jgi:hypothetical protein
MLTEKNLQGCLRLLFALILALIEATSFFVFKKGPSTALRETKQKRYSVKQEKARKKL